MGIARANFWTYRTLLESLLPPGEFFRLERDGDWGDTLGGLAEELARIHNIALEWIIEETDPRTAGDSRSPDNKFNYGGLLADWERVLGLPEPDCAIEALTIEARRLQAAAKISATGGATAAYLVAVAARAGYAITIDANSDGPHPFRCGSTGCDEPIRGLAWAWAFIVNGQLAQALYFRAGTSGCDEPLIDWGNDLLECLINKLKPAESLPHFVYT